MLNYIQKASTRHTFFFDKKQETRNKKQEIVIEIVI